MTGCHNMDNDDKSQNVFNVLYRCPTDQYILISEKMMAEYGGRIQREYACSDHPDKDLYPSLDGKTYSKDYFETQASGDNGVYNIYIH